MVAVDDGLLAMLLAAEVDLVVCSDVEDIGFCCYTWRCSYC